jgi:hypothetical protein
MTQSVPEANHRVSIHATAEFGASITRSLTLPVLTSVLGGALF